MQYIIIIALLLITVIVLISVMGFDLIKIKKIGHDKVLDELVRRFPSNVQICQYILNKLQNNHTKIKESKESTTSLFLIFNDTISIANINNTYTRVQTIAHECIHSMQNKKILWFNFIYSNIYIIAYITIAILTICNIIKNGMLYISVLLLLSIVFYVVRSYLEIEAMVKAKYLAKEYIEENKLTSKGNLDIIIGKYEELNNVGIRTTCCMLISKELIKIAIYSAICIIFI